MEQDKSYKIPEELIEIIEDANAANDAMESAIKLSFFKFQLRNAVELSKIHRKKRGEFWAGVYELYPELASKVLTFDYETKCVTIKS